MELQLCLAGYGLKPETIWTQLGEIDSFACFITVNEQQSQSNWECCFQSALLLLWFILFRLPINCIAWSLSISGSEGDDSEAINRHAEQSRPQRPRWVEITNNKDISACALHTVLVDIFAGWKVGVFWFTGISHEEMFAKSWFNKICKAYLYLSHYKLSIVNHYVHKQPVHSLMVRQPHTLWLFG